MANMVIQLIRIENRQNDTECHYNKTRTMNENCTECVTITKTRLGQTLPLERPFSLAHTYGFLFQHKCDLQKIAESFYDNVYNQA